MPSASPYRSPSKSRTNASTRRWRTSKVGFVPIEIAAAPSGGPGTVRPHSSRRTVAPGVDTVGGYGGPLFSPQVRGREAELAPAPVAALDDAVDPVRTAERLAGRRRVTGLHAGTHIRRAQRRLAVTQQ